MISFIIKIIIIILIHYTSKNNLWYFLGVMRITVTYPKGKSLPKKDDKTIRKSMCALLKDYLPDVFDPKSKLYKRCAVVRNTNKDNGEHSITIDIHLCSTGNFHKLWGPQNRDIQC